MSKIVGLLLLLLLSLSPRGLHAMEDVEQARNLLKKMSVANRQLDYRGIFTYEHAGILKSMRIIHAVREGLEYERILYLSGPRREVVRAGVSPECRSFGDQFLNGVPVPSAVSSSHLEAHYELFLKGEERVADRVVRVLHVIPKDAMRYGYILALDRETGLLLQSLLVGADRRVMERFQFVDIEYGLAEEEVAALVAKADSADGGAISDQCESNSVENVGWQAKWLPDGFKLVSASSPQPEEASMVFSDGLTFVSVFINSEGAPDFPPLQAQRGATVAQMARLNHNGKEFLVCVVGEVPPSTAERIAKFIVPES